MPVRPTRQYSAPGHTVERRAVAPVKELSSQHVQDVAGIRRTVHQRLAGSHPLALLRVDVNAARQRVLARLRARLSRFEELDDGQQTARVELSNGIPTIIPEHLDTGADRSGTPMGRGLAARGPRARAHSPAGTARSRHVCGDCTAVRPGQLSRGAAGTQTHLRSHRTTAALSEATASFVNAVIRAAADLQRVCESEGWQFCFIGGLAVQRWGEPRETVDVDLMLLTGFTGEDRFVSRLLQHFEARMDGVAEFARANRVLLLRTASGVGLDIALGGLPFEESAVVRSSLFTFPPDVPLRTCSAEDLIVLKAFADRPKDWVDVDGIIIRQARTIDWTYVRTQLAPLAELKEDPEIVDRLDARLSELDDRQH